MRTALLLLPLTLIAACDVGTGGGTPEPKKSNAAINAPDAMAARDAASGAALDPAAADPVARPNMQAQVVLDRLGFTPGVVDGKEGMSTRNAVSGFQEANGLPITGQLDEATQTALMPWANIPATRLVTIPADFASGPWIAIPKKPEDQAKLSALGYASLDEKLAERFHTTVAVLKELNSASPATLAAATASSPASETAKPLAAMFAAGQTIRVPNVGGDAVDPAAVADETWRATLSSLGVGSNQPAAAQIVVSKSKGTMKVYDAADKLIAVYTATMGSQYDPLPLGDWKINGKAFNPPFNYNPDLFWDAKAGSQKATLPSGPNGPVGVVWIDLSKPHYGIHGTPNPETIGRAESHGCVRLTNWDAARLAQMVSVKTKVRFAA